MQAHRTHPCRAGFTLVEMLVVIGIIAVLASLITAAAVAAWRKAHETAVISQLRQCELGAQAFFNDYGDYPPSRWAELDELFKYDSNGDGSYVRADDEVFFDGGFPDATTNPSTVNEGIEVFAACMVTRTGGVYIDLDARWLRNIDGQNGVTGFPQGDADDAAFDVARATNWFYGKNMDTNGDGTDDNYNIYEIADWWGNPLVYIHNRDYARYDGWDEVAGNWTTGEAMVYANVNGEPRYCYARSYNESMTGRYPKLNEFQLYSWGPDELPGCLEDPNSPGTPKYGEPGVFPGWTGKSGNLTNWEE